LVARIGLTFDCADAVRLGEFWKLALGYEENPPPAPYTSVKEWLTALGEPDSSPEDGAWLRDPSGVGPSLSILRVPESKVAKNRLHIDIPVSGDGSPEERRAAVTAKVAQLTGAGATTLWESPDHVTMADPEGNEFCVC
jgi:glyoxalase superfamily protein